MNNPYYDPEKCGLEIIETLDESGLCYEFNMLVVWKNKDGKLYFMKDSGCSCPTPFEWCYYNGENDTNLEEIIEGNYRGAIQEIEEFPAESKNLRKYIREYFESKF